MQIVLHWFFIQNGLQMRYVNKEMDLPLNELLIIMNTNIHFYYTYM